MWKTFSWPTEGSRLVSNNWKCTQLFRSDGTDFAAKMIKKPFNPGGSFQKKIALKIRLLGTFKEINKM